MDAYTSPFRPPVELSKVDPNLLDNNRIKLEVTFNKNAKDPIGLEKADFLVSRIYPAEKKHGKKQPPKHKPVAALTVDESTEEAKGRYFFRLTICSSRGDSTREKSFGLSIDTATPHHRYEEAVGFHDTLRTSITGDFRKLTFIFAGEAYKRICELKTKPQENITDLKLPPLSSL